MARKTFLAIHTYKSELAKKNTFESLKNTKMVAWVLMMR